MWLGFSRYDGPLTLVSLFKADDMPKAGDYLEVKSDKGVVDNAPWTTRILEANGWTFWVDDDGDHTYTLDPKNLVKTTTTKSGIKLWIFSKADMTEADLDNGGRLLPDQAPKFKRKKPKPDAQATDTHTA